MRLSCNGCRALRKGCSGDCPIRPCLHWMKSAQSEANATLFLAKFYGRAGLINLINAAAPHLRPATFKSLLHEACGRIVNPIMGCSGLLSPGRWELCEAAVEAVLSGAPITEVSLSSGSMLKACDIRHVANKGKSSCKCNLHKDKVKSRGSRFKRSGGNGKRKAGKELEEWVSDQECGSGVSGHRSRSVGDAADCCSVETVEAEPQPQPQPRCDDGELDLNLTLWWGHLKPRLDNSRLAFVL